MNMHIDGVVGLADSPEEGAAGTDRPGSSSTSNSLEMPGYCQGVVIVSIELRTAASAWAGSAATTVGFQLSIHRRP